MLLAGLLSTGVFGAAPAAASPAPPKPLVSERPGIPHGPGLAMAISPPRLTVPASQTTKRQWLLIQNRGSALFNVHVQLTALVQASGGSTLLDPNAPYSAANWIRVVPDHFQIRPGIQRYVQVRIHVPPNAEPGDHNVAIVFAVPPIPGKGNIHVAEGLGVPILITVPGPVTDDVGVTRLKAPGFSAGGPIPLAATVRESGDVHHSFREAHDRLEAKAGLATVMFPPFTVLRGSTVTIATEWVNPPVICVCHLTTAVVTDSRRSVAVATVIIFPLAPVLITIGVLLALVLGFLLLRRNQRRKLMAAYEAGQQDGQRR